MDTLRLLTRGSGLKIGGGTQLPQKSSSASTKTRISTDSGPQSNKRKRNIYEAVNDREDGKISEDQIRQIQKTHKIKITDLRAFHDTDEHGNRKSQKEASRLFPQPLQTFNDLRKRNVNHALSANIAEQGYKEPTEVQLATIPLLLGQDNTEPDLLTIAPTGSGKTLAFLIPLIHKTALQHKTQDDSVTSQNATTIILAPTKELVTQIVNEGRKLAAKTGVRVTAFKKGMRLHEEQTTSTIRSQSPDSDMSEGESEIKGNIVRVDIIVSSPLSLLHAITQSDSNTVLPLPSITNLVLDEADVLLDPLFREQTLSIWNACTNPIMRASLWSATIGSSIEELSIETINSRHSNLKIKSKDQPSLVRCIIGLKDTSLPNISHKLIYASTEAGKLTGLRNIIRPPPSSASNSQPLRPPFLIFTQTIPRATALHSELQYDVPPSPDASISRIAVLHSHLSSTVRSQIMHNFRLGKIWILITTDLLSRGIDFRGVNAVINYDIPTTTASYVHRAGRTGRASRDGCCVTLYTRDDVQYLKPIATIIKKSQKLHGAQAAEGDIPTWLLDALPALSKNSKKDLKRRGVDVRRGVKQSDDKKDRRNKLRNTIGTKSGYDKKVENNRRGMIEGSQRRAQMQNDDDEDDNDNNEDGFDGFD